MQTTTDSQMRAAWAWRQPAFSKETIEADPWTVVYLPIPDGMPARTNETPIFVAGFYQPKTVILLEDGVFS
jgi:hypothetical protein